MYSVRISQFQGKYIQNTEQNSQKYLVRSTPSTSSKKVSRSMDEEKFFGFGKEINSLLAIARSCKKHI